MLRFCQKACKRDQAIAFLPFAPLLDAHAIDVAGALGNLDQQLEHIQASEALRRDEQRLPDDRRSVRYLVVAIPSRIGKSDPQKDYYSKPVLVCVTGHEKLYQWRGAHKVRTRLSRPEARRERRAQNAPGTRYSVPQDHSKPSCQICLCPRLRVDYVISKTRL